ncbi:MAG: DUF433 domain-containing protein [bacterium]
MNQILHHISDKPDVCPAKPSVDKSCMDKPYIADTRISVSLVLDLLDGGMSVEEIIVQYPQLTEEDIQAAIAYGAAWREL